MTEPAFLGDWEVMSPLDLGAQARTFVVRRGDETAVAKVLKDLTEGSKADSREEQIRRFVTEVNTLRSLEDEGCPRIVRVLDTSIGSSATDTDGDLFYVMPYFEAGPLRQADGRFVDGVSGNVDRVLGVVAEVADTIAFLHQRAVPVTHRDLHTGNILFFSSDGAPHVADFGLAYEAEREEAGLKTGTRENEEFGPWRWRPPELTQASSDKRNPKSDVYMLGGITYECLSGGDYIDDVEPTPGRFGHETPVKDLAARIEDPRLPLVNRLLRSVLVRNPDLRLTATEFREGLTSVRQFSASGPPPQLPTAPALARAEAKLQASVRVRRERLKTELSAVGTTLAQEIGFRDEKPRWQISRLIDAWIGEPRCADRYPGFVFGGGVRVIIGADLQKGEIPFICSYFFVARSNTAEIVIAERYPNYEAQELSTSFTGDPQHSDLIAEEARQELARLEPLYASVVEDHLL